MNTEKLRQDLQAILDQLPKPEPQWTPPPVPDTHEIAVPKEGEKVKGWMTTKNGEGKEWEPFREDDPDVFGPELSRSNWIYIRHKPAKRTYWSKPEHVPGPVCWLRKKGGTAQSLVTYLDTLGLLLSESLHIKNGSEAVLWGDLERFEHSTDRTTWKPCTL